MKSKIISFSSSLNTLIELGELRKGSVIRIEGNDIKGFTRNELKDLEYSHNNANLIKFVETRELTATVTKVDDEANFLYLSVIEAKDSKLNPDDVFFLSSNWGGTKLTIL